MQYIGIFWIIVFIINIAMVLASIKLKNNIKIIIASLLLIFINFGSYFIFYIITKEYLSPIAAIEAYVVLLVTMSPMIFSLILLMIRAKKPYQVSSMIYLDIIASNLCFITFMYCFAMADLVNYILKLFTWIDVTVIMFVVILVGKWIYIYATGRKRVLMNKGNS